MVLFLQMKKKNKMMLKTRENTIIIFNIIYFTSTLRFIQQSARVTARERETLYSYLSAPIQNLYFTDVTQRRKLLIDVIQPHDGLMD